RRHTRSKRDWSSDVCSSDLIQPALRDRMEIINVTGYTIEEKVQIAKKHLFPKQLEEHGMKSKDLKINDSALEFVIEGYTRESGEIGRASCRERVERGGEGVR